ncbi:MAG: YiiX/YebB-like N1pC/P60 family cysteine hydrolase [Bacteroidia bacterium]
MNYLPLFILLLFASCSNPKRDRQQNPDTAVTVTPADTPKASEISALDTPARNPAAVMNALDGLPDLMEGDIIVQDIQNSTGDMMREAMPSEWSNIGIIFRRDADGVMIVIDAVGKVRITPLAEWISAGRENKLALYRLQDGENLLVPKNSRKLRAACQPFKTLPADLYFGWSDTEIYSSELVWKVYQNGLGISLCPLRKLSTLKLDGAKVKPNITKKYGATVPATEMAVTIADIYSSPQLKLLYAR